MKKIKALLAEFKAFITRGNVVDMAVAVIIGAAFGAIVTSMTDGIIKPLVDWAVASAGGGEGIGLITMLKPGFVLDANGVATDVIDLSTSIYINWGDFIMKVIDFLLIALVLFAIIKVFMGIKNAATKAADKAKKKAEKLAEKYKKAGMSEEEAKAAAEATVAAEAPAAPAEPPKPTTDELLTEIRDLLAAQNRGGKDAE